MKSFYLAIPVLLAAFLFGCDEPSTLSGPVSNNSISEMTKPFDGIPIDEIIVAPSGAKFNVSGLIEYQYFADEDAGVLYTNVYLSIIESGTGRIWAASGEHKVKLNVDEYGMATLKESHSMVSPIGHPSKEYGIEINYRTEKQTVTIDGIEIQLLAAAFIQPAD
jgi:hypothetical protein